MNLLAHLHASMYLENIEITVSGISRIFKVRGHQKGATTSGPLRQVWGHAPPPESFSNFNAKYTLTQDSRLGVGANK